MRERAFGAIMVVLAVLGAGCRDRSATSREGRDVVKQAAANGVRLTSLDCQVVPKVRAEGRCLASVPAVDSRKLAASMAFARGTPSNAASTRPEYSGGCGSLRAVTGASAVEIYTYVPGVSPRISWNEIWVLPLDGRVCIELSHAKES